MLLYEKTPHPRTPPKTKHLPMSVIIIKAPMLYYPASPTPSFDPVLTMPVAPGSRVPASSHQPKPKNGSLRSFTIVCRPWISTDATSPKSGFSASSLLENQYHS